MPVSTFDFRQTGSTPYKGMYRPGFLHTGSTSGGGIATGFMSVMPFTQSRANDTIDEIGFFSQLNGSAGAVARMGVYAPTSSQNLYPAALIIDMGDIAIDTGHDTYIHYTISLPVTGPNLYWIAFTKTGTGFSLDSGWGVQTLGLSATDLASNANGWRVAYTHSAGLSLPSTFPAGGSPWDSIGTPYFLVHLA